VSSLPTKKPPGIWSGQALHFVGLTILLDLVVTAWRFQGEPFPLAFGTAAVCPILHQVFVWLAWRFELRSSATSKAIGFRGYLACFYLLFASRFVSLIALAWLDRGSLKLDIVPQAVVATILFTLGLYAGYSVNRYFGFVRAAGVDHFDPRYRELPLVKDGIFRFTSNGMYIYAFLLFWAIAVSCNSSAALTIAAFSHAYIWVHFYATEKPDMDFLYGSV